MSNLLYYLYKMKENTFNWQTKANLNIYAKEWIPEKTKAVICLVHGLGEHVGRYEHVAEYFGNHGYAMIGNDHHGHGKSGGKRGHVPDYETFMEEISQLVVMATERHPDKPIFLYGHSMGGNLAMNYVLQRHPQIAGMVTTGPAIRVPKANQPSAALMTFAKIMDKIYPSLQQPNGLDEKGVCADPAVVEKYKADPLVHDKISIRTALGLLSKGEYLDNYSGKMPIPTLLMHGEKDTLTDPDGSIEFAKRVKENLTFRLWNGLLHEIHNEPQQNQVFEYTLNWMNSKM